LKSILDLFILRLLVHKNKRRRKGKMKRQKKLMMLFVTTMAVVAIGVFVPGLVCAGDLEPPGPPTEGTMHTLDEIYNKLQMLSGGVPKTGQTTSFATGDDGELQRGVPWPDPRFTDHKDGTVTDELTNLMWTKDANIYGSRNWNEALADCAICTEGGYKDWSLPNVRELHSLVDYGRDGPALPASHPFKDVQSHYWSSTTGAGNAFIAWYAHLGNGWFGRDSKTFTLYVWCVRGEP
jgi:hypothetical protein